MLQHPEKTIFQMYFIWSTDETCEAVVGAAERTESQILMQLHKRQRRQIDIKSFYNVENECHIATNTNSFEPLRCHSLIVPWMICHRKTRHTTTVQPLQTPPNSIRKYTIKLSSGGASTSLSFTFNTVLCQKIMAASQTGNSPLRVQGLTWCGSDIR